VRPSGWAAAVHHHDHARQAMDGFLLDRKGLNWDAYGHHPGSSDPLATLACTPDANGYNTGVLTAVNYYEWCQDHNKPLQAAPFGDLAAEVATLPDANLLLTAPGTAAVRIWAECDVRATGPTGTTPPLARSRTPRRGSGLCLHVHSHNEREITTNNIFPGGMLMMMLVDSREFVIDESN